MKDKFFNKIHSFYRKKYIGDQLLDQIVFKVSNGIYDVSDVNSNFDFIVSKINIDEHIKEESVIGPNWKIFYNTNNETVANFISKLNMAHKNYFLSIVNNQDSNFYPIMSADIQQNLQAKITIPISEMEKMINTNLEMSKNIKFIFSDKILDYKIMINHMAKYFDNVDTNLEKLESIKFNNLDSDTFVDSIKKIKDIKVIGKHLIKNRNVNNFFLDYWDFNLHFYEDIYKLKNFDVNKILKNVNGLGNVRIKAMIHKYYPTITAESWETIIKVSREIIINELFHLIPSDIFEKHFNRDEFVDLEFEYTDAQLQFLVNSFGNYEDFVFDGYNATYKFGILSNTDLDIIPKNIEEVSEFIIENELDKLRETFDPDNDHEKLIEAVFASKAMKRKFVLMNSITNVDDITKGWPDKNISFFEEIIKKEPYPYLQLSYDFVESWIQDQNKKILFIINKTEKNYREEKNIDVNNEFNRVTKEVNKLLVAIARYSDEEVSENTVKGYNEIIKAYEKKRLNLLDKISDFIDVKINASNISKLEREYSSLQQKFINDKTVVEKSNDKLGLKTPRIKRGETKKDYMKRISEQYDKKITEFTMMSNELKKSDNTIKLTSYRSVKKHYTILQEKIKAAESSGKTEQAVENKQVKNHYPSGHNYDPHKDE